MAAIAPAHAANIVAKTIRWADALAAADALGVPTALLVLERQGPVGKALADDGWDHLADLVVEFTGRAKETAPRSTREAIAQRCAQMAKAA